MARKRQIDPGIWVSEQFTNLQDPWARLLFVGMFSNADDEGRLKASPAYLKMLIFPGEAFEPEKVQEWRQQIAEQGLIHVYTNGSDPTEYLCLPTWKQHQYISRRVPSHLPSPPEQLPHTSRTPPEQLPHTSAPDEVEVEVEVGTGIEVGTDNEDEVVGKEVALTTTATTFNALLLSNRDFFTKKFPTLDLDWELEKCKEWWAGQRKVVKRPKVAFMNWIEKASARKGEQNGQPRPGGFATPQRGVQKLPKTYSDPEEFRRRTSRAEEDA